MYDVQSEHLIVVVCACYILHVLIKTEKTKHTSTVDICVFVVATSLAACLAAIANFYKLQLIDINDTWIDVSNWVNIVLVVVDILMLVKIIYGWSKYNTK